MTLESSNFNYYGLRNKVAVITGGCGGIGKETSLLLAKHGCKIAILDLDISNSETIVSEIIRLGGKAFVIKTDLRKSCDCKAAIKSVIDEYGTIDIVVNAAGTIIRSSIVDTSESDWDDVMDVNVKSVYLISKYSMEEFSKKGEGIIINVASGWGVSAGANAAAYCASKGAVIQLTKAMAIDHGPQGVRVNCVSPGDTDTGMLRSEERQLGLPTNSLNEEAKNRPLGRVGKGEDIAEGIAYLSSNQSSYITGTNLIVDGGGLAGSM